MSIYAGLPFQPDMKRKRKAVRKLDDGREILDLKTSAGRKLYKERLTMAWVKQKGRCALCGLPVALELATVDHRNPRGMGGGSRDDSEGNLQMACWKCNTLKGSKRIA